METELEKINIDGLKYCFCFFFLIKEVYASLIMALVGVELETLVSEPDALTTVSGLLSGVKILFFFYYIGICIIDNGASIIFF